MTSLLLIRHGETDWNIEGRYQGQADPPLNAKGVAQAHVIAEELSGARVAVLYSSPLRRARQTAEILARSFALPLYIEPRLMEIHQGDWQTRLRSEITALYPDLFHRWETEPWQVNPPGGEPLTQVQERVYAAV
ncbi:MAG: histidine phosphatase family protein, partial [Candidatus Neomarinimicrobiota bacterium]